MKGTSYLLLLTTVMFGMAQTSIAQETTAQSSTTAKGGNPTVAQYAVSRLADLGIKHAFGLPGDYTFPIDDAIQDDPRLRWVLDANELNAAYAADGYARINGASILTTTYGVGELSALNGVMGAYAEHSTVFHLVGAPPTRLTRARYVMHHSLGTGDTGQYFHISASAACVSTYLTPENAIDEMERIIKVALLHRQPAYIQIAMDIGDMEVVGEPVTGVSLQQIPPPGSEPNELKAAIEAVKLRFQSAQKPVILAGYKTLRWGLRDALLEVVDATGIPFATTGMDKGVLPENHPKFLGMYLGQNTNSEIVKQAVELADLVLDLGGVLFDDESTGFSTAFISRDALVSIAPMVTTLGLHMDWVHQRVVSYAPAFMGDMLKAIAEFGLQPNADNLQFPVDALSVNNFSIPDYIQGPGLSYMSLVNLMVPFFGPTDILVFETGTINALSQQIPIPGGATYLVQTMYGSIGWATAAGFGAALAAPDRKVTWGGSEFLRSVVYHVGMYCLGVCGYILFYLLLFLCWYVPIKY